MKFISAQPDTDYFIWQLKVQMNNFKKFGIEQDAFILLGYDPNNGANPNAIKFISETKANVVLFPDNRTPESRSYISTIRPYLLKLFFKSVGRHIDDDFFYHDSDILFSSLPNFNLLLKKKKLMVSDTISYIGAKYITSKGEGLLEEMCLIVGIDPKLVIKNEKKSGGAQYLIPKSFKMSNGFWDKVEKDSYNLYSVMNATAHKYNPSHPIQAWTADMWALLWNFWLGGLDSLITKELDFSWPTYSINDWDKFNIFHNAGVTPDRTELFFKGNFISTSPFDANHDNVSNVYLSYKYLEAIFEAKKRFENKISCVMCTYGRFNMVERSLSFFLDQDYPNKELIIFNTAQTPLILDESLNNKNIVIINNSNSYETNLPYTNIGDIRRDALTHATGNVYSCWDDDDFFMPYHLSQSNDYLLSTNKKAWKPKYSWWSTNGGKTFEKMGNNMEASVLVYIDQVFFLKKTGDEHLGWFKKLMDENQLDESIDVAPFESYCYVWGDELAMHKQSGDITNPNNFENHKTQSTDFGNAPLKYIDVSKHYYNVWKTEKNPELLDKLRIYISKYLL